MGKPDKVGFTFSKLHDVSKAQKILIGLYCFITTVKIIDTALSVVFASPFQAEPFTDALFPFFANFFYLVIFITCGIALSLRTYRKAPAAFAAILTAADYYSVFVFNLVSFTTLKGKLSDVIMHIVWEEYATEVILTEEYIIVFSSLLRPLCLSAHSLRFPARLQAQSGSQGFLRLFRVCLFVYQRYLFSEFAPMSMQRTGSSMRNIRQLSTIRWICSRK